ncbi:MAG: hypothetical protein VZR23_11175, partial [Lachnospiraceae bacterium]|nr:hypothetical protein [Lachnospiraceae bacterium]
FEGFVLFPLAFLIIYTRLFTEGTMDLKKFTVVIYCGIHLDTIRIIRKFHDAQELSGLCTVYFKTEKNIRCQ